jgi:DNA-binding transcriptional LysR family regulator
LKQEYPELLVTILEGTYESLLTGLRCGDIDLLVGVLRYPIPCNDIVQERLFEDLLSVVGRKGHPFASARSLRLADVIDSEWVLPYKGAPSRKAFEQVMNAAGLPLPKNAIESNALVTLRALLMESDRLSILSRNQIHYEELHGMLSVLPIDMRGSERPIGITTRADAKRSIGLNALLQDLRAVSGEMKDGPRGA